MKTKIQMRMLGLVIAIFGLLIISSTKTKFDLTCYSKKSTVIEKSFERV